MGRTYIFHSSLPPEQVPCILPKEWKTCGQPSKLEISIKTKWRNKRFTVTRTTTRRYTPGDGWVPTVRGIGWTKGLRTDWQWNNPFCGEVRSDGQGGSVLSGRFRIHPVGKLVFAMFPPIIVYSLWLLSPHTAETLVAAAVAAALYLRHLIHTCRAIDSHDGVEDILRFLRENFEEVEE